MTISISHWEGLTLLSNKYRRYETLKNNTKFCIQSRIIFGNLLALMRLCSVSISEMPKSHSTAALAQICQGRLFESVYKILCCFVEFSIAYTCFSVMESSDRPSQCEIWVVIKFLNKKQVSACEVHQRFCAVYGEACLYKAHKT